MNHSLLAFLSVAFILGPASIVPMGAAASSGYVAYSVNASFNGRQQRFSVNESVSPNPNQGNSILSLVVMSASANLTYSRLVNSSLTLLPYMPAVTNQTYTYSNDSYAVAARITQIGTSQVTFQGSAYTLNDYAFYANFTRGETSRDASGNLSVLPSGLVFMMVLATKSATVTAVLTSTSLPLQANSADSSLQMASAGVSVSAAAAAVAVALSLGIRARRKKRPSAVHKPDHWVD